MQTIVILISGRGSNMERIVESCLAESWPARVAAVLSNRADAAGLSFAASRGIATTVVDHRAYPAREAFDVALLQALLHAAGGEPDLVVLAGFMRILTPAFVRRFAGRLLNIHPSLLPAFAGLHTHRRALEAGCQLVGATVHFVTDQLDHGPIVMQSVVPVRPGDDETALAARVLATEHVIYPRSVRWFVEGRLRIEGLRVVQLDGAAQWLLPASVAA